MAGRRLGRGDTPGRIVADGAALRPLITLGVGLPLEFAV
jgi:hypothetical protein